MKQPILFASSNENKLSEMQFLFSSSEWEIVSPKSVGIQTLNIAEHGNSYMQNAIYKIEAYEKYTNLPILADDSGLEVDYLNGQPGIFSARFGGSHANSDKQRNKYLIKLMSNAKSDERSATFKAVLVIRFFNDQTIIREGNVKGQIIFEPRGENGFGYDPIFQLDNGKTMAEYGEKKHAISHRALAVKSLLEVI
ncbi:MAG: non-canonical purine NTP pyrophosphatase, RdgB/HAM1 family [Dehalococcoidaceae bacterium]|nr:non-canonical purine NTP pyrophosphatase, RdgB/HAM1 family [Dehalococcoidaceae bacterium]